MTIELERKTQRDESPVIGSFVMTPPIEEEYWRYRVKLSDTQAIVGFPKFGTIGIGFAVEDDWNTNLPYTSPTEEIYDHIKHNKGNKAIRKADCIIAIRMVQEAATADRKQAVK